MRYVPVVGAVIVIPLGAVLSKMIAHVTFTVPVLPTRSVMKILKLINHSVSPAFVI